METNCGSDVSSCGGLNGYNCATCPAYNSKLDTRGEDNE